jgi:diguanylate cyclase (GGDEF)-like protein
VLVVLPVSSLGAFAVVLSARAAAAATASSVAVEQVRAFGQLARASAAVDQELLTLVAAAALDDPATRDDLGITAPLAPEVAAQVAATVQRVSAQTDTQLAAATALADSADAARAAQARVAELRRTATGGGILDLAALANRWEDVSRQLHARQNAVVVAAASSAASTVTVAAIRDVRLLADLAATLSPDLVDYLGWALQVPGPDGPLPRSGWLQSHIAVQLARNALATITDDGLRAQGAALAATPEAVLVDAALSAALDGPVALPPVAQLQALVLAATTVADQTVDVLGDAVEVVARSAAADGDAAAAERDATVLLAGSAVLGTVIIGFLVGQQVTRSLRRLSGQADQVSQGRLVDVDAGGPREVRSVGRALGAAVESLRRVQDQAGAVARGDLAAPVLDDALPGPLGEVLHASVEQLVSSLRQRDALQKALTHEAAHDPLTDLPNRGQALRLTTSALHRARRAGAATGLLFVDLDGFKGVNDSAGHAAGDAVLRTVAARMRAVARAGDTVCRLGGDEFVVLVEAVDDLADLVRLGERLVQAVSRPLAVATAAGARQVSVGASVGVALAQDGEVDGDELLARADAAVYRAKHAGRGRVEVFDDRLRAHLDDRRDVEEALRVGLASGQLHLLYQPVLEVPSGTLLGFEAQPQWARPGLGLLTREAFVAVAEQSDLVCDLDRWVLRSAVDQLAAWRAEAGLTWADTTGPVVSVDVSARLLGDPRVTDLVLGMLVEAGLPACCLVLEVAEGAVVDSPGLLTRMAELRALGVRVALDDFGTGTTSIGALRHLPVDVLKVRSRSSSTDPTDEQLVALVVAAARASGLSVVAEGVDGAAQWSRLTCDAAQGHHLSAPLAADGAGALFRAGTATVVP